MASRPTSNRIPGRFTRGSAVTATALLAVLATLPAVGLAQAPPAAAPEAPVAPAATAGYALQAGRLEQVRPDGSRQVLAAPCPATVLAQAPERLLLGCPGGKVVVLCLHGDAAPTECGTLQAGGEIAGFFQAGDRWWVEVRRSEARPLAELGAASGEAGASAVALTPVAGTARPAAPPAAAAAQPPAALAAAAAAAGRPVEGSVIESQSGRVVIDLGSGQGLRRGERVGFYREHEVDLGGGMKSTEEELLGVGEVSAVSEGRSQVQLGLNERIPAGTRARRTSARVTENRYVPPRMDGIWELGFMARPFIAVGSFGFGTVSDALISLRRPDHTRLQLLLAPAGVGYADEGNVLSVAGNVVASYDTQLFEIGLGVGWSAVNRQLLTKTADAASESGAGAIEAKIDRVESGMSIVQLARLGATDGLQATVLNTFLLYEDTFHYGGTLGQLQLPVSRRSWLLVRGGGGTAGYGFGEVGLRWLARGNGDRGSLFLTVTAGGAALAGQKDDTCREYVYDPDDGSGSYQDVDCTKDVSYGGPMVGFGAEWRL